MTDSSLLLSREQSVLPVPKTATPGFKPKWHFWFVLGIVTVSVPIAFWTYRHSPQHFYGFFIIEAAGLVTAAYAALAAAMADAQALRASHEAAEAASKAASAATEAANAASQSQETQNQLVDIGILPGETRGTFQRIFEEHLIEPLKDHSYEKDAASIYLLLSTPAYGYGVVGAEGFRSFASAIGALNQGCKVEAVFFSPDAHFHYWCNLLLWAIARPEKQNFAIEFGSQVLSFRELIANKDWQMWFIGETTVRLFAFQSREGRTDEELRAYLLLVDRFNIAQNQFGDKFRARSVRILSVQVQEYVTGENSYFDRIKQCAYTLRREGVSLKQRADTSLFEYVVWDYVLGRTSQKPFADFGWFKSEFDLFFRELKKEIRKENTNSALHDCEIVKQLCEVVCYYFSEMLSVEYPKASQRIKISDKQRARLTWATAKIRELCTPPSKSDIEGEQSVSVATSPPPLDCKAASVLDSAVIGLTEQQNKRDEFVAEHEASFTAMQNEALQDRFAYCLFVLLTSGAAESQYAEAVKNGATEGD